MSWATKLFLLLVGIVMLLYFFNKACLWLEEKGWLYYRKNKPKESILGNVLQELNVLLNPSTRHVVEVKQKKETVKKASDQPEIDD